MTDVSELTGRELDAAVAEKVMGWELLYKPFSEPIRTSRGWPPTTTREDVVSGQEPIQVPPYGSDIAAAWPVVEKLDLFGRRGGFVTILSRWLCGDTAPEAICHTALEAVRAANE